MTSSQPDTPSPQPLSRKQERGSSTRERGSGAAGFMLEANWDAPANVHAFTTLRCGAGSSQAPFDEFNLGNARAADGDDPAVVARNRAELIERAGLPSPLRWLRQVHGTRVLRFGAGAETHPHPSPPLEGEGARAGAGAEPEADAAVTSTPGVVLAILTRSEEHTSELQSLMRISYAGICLKKKKKYQTNA